MRGVEFGRHSWLVHSWLVGASFPVSRIAAIAKRRAPQRCSGAA
jgi:hypothetical protein